MPTLYGQTEEAQQKKSVGARREWDEESLLAEIQTRHGTGVARVARQIADWMKSVGGNIWFGTGTQDGSMGLGLASEGRNYYPLWLRTYGRLEVAFQYISNEPTFQAEAKRRELLRRLNHVPGISLPDDAIQRRPSIPLAVLSDGDRWSSLRDVLDWLVAEIRSR